MFKNYSGGYNSSLGYNSLYQNTTGFYNTATGFKSAYNNTTGFSNTASGYNSLLGNTSGSYNTAIGRNAGYKEPDNSYCTYIGTSADATANSLTNATAIGNNAKVNASNKVVVGNTSVTVIGGQVGWSILSDGRFKKDIQQNVPGLSFINKIKPVTYHIDQEKLDNFLNTGNTTDETIKNDFSSVDKKLRSGFIAQDVEKAAKEINYDFDGINIPQNEKDNYSLIYADFVPSLVKAVQELSSENNLLKQNNASMQQQIDELKTMMQNLVINNALSTADKNVNLPAASLEQNTPNPFNHNTSIRYYIPVKFATAQIIVTDNNGKTLKQIAISATGKGMINIDAGSLSAGIYHYTLVVDGKLIESKTMVITK